MATILLAPAPAEPKFAMERSLLRTMSERRPEARKSSEGSKPRYSTTTLKYSQMPLPTPPDSAGAGGLESFQLQFTLMPPTPAESMDPIYTGMLPPKKKRRSIQVPYLLTVQDIVEDDGCTDAFSPSSTNYSATSEFGPFSMRNTLDLSNAPPLPERASQLISASHLHLMKKRSPLAMQTSADDFDQEDDNNDSLKPIMNTLITSNLPHPTDYDALYSPITPVTPNLPFGPTPTAAPPMPALPNKRSLAERRARKAPAPLANNRPLNGSSENLPTSPPPLTARSFAQAQAAIPQSARSIQVPMSAVNGGGSLPTPQTATFMPQAPKAVKTPITPGFPNLAGPGTPMSAAFFSPRSGVFPPYVPHSATVAAPSPRFLPIHQDIDRDALKSPRGVNMLVEHAQGQQVGFTSELMPSMVKERFETLWQVANAQADVDDVFSLEMFRQDSFTFTGAEHYTFGPDFNAPFYRISAHPSHEQDAIFSDLKIHRCSPNTAAEIPVIHLQLEAPTVESSGVVALIYPQVAGLMLGNGHSDIKNNPRMDVAEEKECCRLVYEVNKGFALYHPFKGEDGGWLNVEVEGRVGFDAIGASGTISLLNPATDEALVSLDFSTCELFINSQACKAIPSLFIVDVAVAAVLTVATVEGRRLRVIQEDLEQIMAYEMATSPRPEEDEEERPSSAPQNISEETLAHAAQADYSFATAVGRMGATMAVTEGQKIVCAKGQPIQKQSVMSKIASAFRRMFRKMARKPAFSPEFEQVTFINSQKQQQDSNHHVFTPQPIMIQSRI